MPSMEDFVNEGHSVADIARRLDRSPTWVWHHLNTKYCDKGAYHGNLQEEIEMVMELYNKGWAIHDISHRIGRSTSWIYARMDQVYTRESDYAKYRGEQLKRNGSFVHFAEELDI